MSEILNRIKRAFQILITGWADYETWSLDVPMAINILPRLKKLKESTIGHPCDLTEKQWYAILDKMIFAMEEISKDYPNRFEGPKTKKELERYGKKMEEGCLLFGKYFMNLWW